MNAGLRFTAYAIATAVALSACAGKGSGGGTPPISPAGKTAAVTLTVTRGTSYPYDLPASTQSVDAAVYAGNASSGTSVASSCVNFTSGSSQATVNITVPYGTQTFVSGAWSGPCSANAGGGTLLRTFTGTGQVNVSAASAQTLFNGGRAIAFGVPLGNAPNTPVVLDLRSIGPVYPQTSDYPGASGKFQSFAMVTSRPSTMYIAGGFGRGQNVWEVPTQAGVYRTQDGGATWSAIDTGLTDTAVNDLYLDQQHPNVLLAATQNGGIFRSADSGDSWVHVYGLGSLQVTQFAAIDGDVYAASADGVLVSHDDGQTWSVSLAPQGADYPISVGAAAGVLYAGFTHELFFVYAGGSWAQRTTLPIPAQRADLPAVNEIVPDPLAPDTVYATVWGSPPPPSAPYHTDILYVSEDGGRSWVLANTPPGWYGAQVLAMSATIPHDLYAAAEGAQWSSTDGGVTWAAQAGDGDQRGLYVYDGGGHDSCYVPSDQGVFYFPACGSDAGEVNLTKGLSTNVITGFATHANTIMAMQQDFTAAISTNGGSAWTWPRASFWEAGNAWIDPYDPAYCYGADAGGYEYSTDGCNSFSIGGSLPVDNLWLSFDAQQPQNVFAAASWKGTPAAYESVDHGATYTRLSWSIQPFILQVDPRNDLHIVAEAQGPQGTGLYASADGGSSWSYGAALTGCKASDLPRPIAMAPQIPDVIVALGCDGTVLRSSNGGFSYQQFVPAGLSQAAARVSAVRKVLSEPRNERAGEGFGRRAEAEPPRTVLSYQQHMLAFNDRGTPAYLALATPDGLFISTDWGNDWQRVDTNTISHFFSAVQFGDGELYAASWGSGILSARLP